MSVFDLSQIFQIALTENCEFYNIFATHLILFVLTFFKMLWSYKTSKYCSLRKTTTNYIKKVISTNLTKSCRKYLEKSQSNLYRKKNSYLLLPMKSYESVSQ